MSEANLPSSDPSQNQTSPDSSWDGSENAAQMNPTDGSAETQAEGWQDWQTVDFPNALSVDAIERQSLYSSDDVPPLDWLAQATPNPNAAHLWSTGAGNSTELPETADLIALIQELNQCNDVLLDRVSQLEESLEHGQKAHISGVNEPPLSDVSQKDPSQINQELVEAQTEIAQLSKDLEFAQQTNQRQQILLETLTGQLEGSQERVAQLERECALTQQRYSEQSHQLTQSENTCRDLHARLQRQQRYTLQFKAALEKCLEVPPPSYETKESVVEAIATSQSKHDSFTPQPFLPRAKRIQPWSAQPPFLSDLSDLNVDDVENLDETQLTPHAQAETKLDSRQFHPLAAASLDLSTVVASIIHPEQSQSAESTVEPAAGVELAASGELAASVELAVEQTEQSKSSNLPSNAVSRANPQSVSYDLKQSAGWWNEATSQSQSAKPAPTPQAELPQADRMHSEAQPGESLPVSPETPISVETESNLTSSLTFSDDSASQSNDAEDALWQDLARLIDVSTEDVVQANLSDGFDSFEAIAPSPSNSQPTPPSDSSSVNLPKKQPQPQALDIKQQITQGISIAKLLLSSTQSAATEQPAPAVHAPDQTAESEQKVLGAFTANSNWPSPIVYPLRTPRKIESLAAVKLPTFPR